MTGEEKTAAGFANRMDAAEAIFAADTEEMPDTSSRLSR
jgi:hypothetical protein